jgi:hypothetical protein
VEKAGRWCAAAEEAAEAEADVAAEAFRRCAVDAVAAVADDAFAAPRVGGRLAVPLLPVDDDCADGGRRTVADDRVVADGGLDGGLDGGFVAGLVAGLVAVAVAVAADELDTIDADLFRVWPRTGPDAAELPAAERVRVIAGAAVDEDCCDGSPPDDVGRPLDDVGRRWATPPGAAPGPDEMRCVRDDDGGFVAGLVAIDDDEGAAVEDVEVSSGRRSREDDRPPVADGGFGFWPIIVVVPAVGFTGRRLGDEPRAPVCGACAACSACLACTAAAADADGPACGRRRDRVRESLTPPAGGSCVGIDDGGGIGMAGCVFLSLCGCTCCADRALCASPTGLGVSSCVVVSRNLGMFLFLGFHCPCR